MLWVRLDSVIDNCLENIWETLTFYGITRSDKEVEEAARIDGASYLKIFYKIVLPLTLPALASLVALQFIWVWNDFFFAIVLIGSPESRLATQAVASMPGRLFDNWPLLSAASIIVMIIPIGIYVALQRYYVRGLVAGAVKG